MTSPCGECGMRTEADEYHPYAACLMFKACHDSDVVHANLDAVVAHGIQLEIEANDPPRADYRDAAKLMGPNDKGNGPSKRSLRRSALNAEFGVTVGKLRKDNNMKVFLGGTCNESAWRNRIIPMLEIEFFDPVVEDWTPECMAEEIRQRQECDLCLYVITPKMTGVFSIAEVIDDSNKRPERTVFVRLRDDGDERFTDGQWKSLGAVAQMVERNGGTAFDSLKSAALHINEVTTITARGY